jgi:hypothetical protein
VVVADLNVQQPGQHPQGGVQDRWVVEEVTGDDEGFGESGVGVAEPLLRPRPAGVETRPPDHGGGIAEKIRGRTFLCRLLPRNARIRRPGPGTTPGTPWSPTCAPPCWSPWSTP